MKNIIPFSGGKDSLSTLLWAKENLSNFEVIFCDTGWESDITLQHIKDVSAACEVEIKTLMGKYSFEELAKKKKRVPSTKARFCTDHLKVRVMIDFILDIKEDVTIYQGIRAQESKARRMMKSKDEYFRPYIEGHKNLYRKKDVLEHLQDFLVDVERPVFNLTANEVFAAIRKAGIPPNPLYKLGFTRVGCFPCIMCRHSEVRLLVKHFPERINVIRSLEKELGRSFFPPGYIPDWACSGIADNGRKFPWIEDVVKYLVNPNQKELFQAPSCQSVYSICE